MARLLSTCAKIVYRSFRRFEKQFDRINRVVGPIFVSIACIAIGGCAFAFFDVVFPHVFLQPDTSWTYILAGTAWCAYLVVMFSFHVRSLSPFPSRSKLIRPSIAAVLQSDHDPSREPVGADAGTVSPVDFFRARRTVRPTSRLELIREVDRVPLSTRASGARDPTGPRETISNEPGDPRRNADCGAESGDPSRTIRARVQKVSADSDGSSTSQARANAPLLRVQDLRPEIRPPVSSFFFFLLSGSTH